jgi:hypothetical protein
MLQNVISPKSSATTVATLPGWETWKKTATLSSITTREVVSKKESSLGQKFTILEASSVHGKVNITIDEAKLILEGTKAFELVYKMSTAKTKEGDAYLNLVISSKKLSAAEKAALEAEGVQNEN